MQLNYQKVKAKTQVSFQNNSRLFKIGRFNIITEFSFSK
jgi:hypothetical protein